MKNFILFTTLPFFILNTFLQASEQKPLANFAQELRTALSHKNTPEVKPEEIFSMAAIGLATGKIGYDLSSTCWFPIRVACTVVPAALAFIVNGAFTERGRFLLAQRALDTNVLNTLENAHLPLPVYLQEQLKEAHDVLRPTHWISKKYIAPLLIQTT